MTKTEPLLLQPGFEEDDIKIMLDSFEKEDPMWPKKRKILNQLEAICSGREAGDVVVLHFSGHGARLKTDDPDEEDGKDECIIAANMKPIRDDQLKSCIDKLPDGVNFTMIADCCHSGGMLDHQEILIEGYLLFTPIHCFSDLQITSALTLISVYFFMNLQG